MMRVVETGIAPSFWRYRIRFCKRGTARFISHKDLMGVLARAFRRAGLPVRMTEGFNPHPRFSLPSPLSLGIEGLDEILELELVEELPPDDVARKLQCEMPQGISVHRAERLGSPQKARVDSVTYRLMGEVDPAAFENRDAVFKPERNGREFDVLPYVRRIERIDGGIECEVVVTNAGTAKPAELALAFCGGDAEKARRLTLVRTAINLASPA